MRPRHKAAENISVAVTSTVYAARFNEAAA